LFGGAIGAAVSIPLTRRAAAMAQTNAVIRAQGQAARDLELMSALGPDDIALVGQRASRPLGAETDDRLARGLSINMLREDQLTARNAARNESLSPNERIVEDPNLESRRAVRQDFQREIALRRLEELGATPDNLWGFMDNMFTDSVLYKAVSTPFKRVMQSDFMPGYMKQAMVHLVGDRGLSSMANRLGITSGATVYERAMVRNGEWFRANRDLLNVYRSEKNRTNLSVLDVDVGVALGNLRKNGDNFNNWMTSLNEKRTRKITNLTNAEREGVKIIDDFFKRAERELQDVGLISTQKGLKARLDQIDAIIQDLQLDLARLNSAGDARLAAKVKGRIDELQQQRASVDASYEAQLQIPPSGISDPFLPRFYNQDAIRADRDGFAQVLRDWYRANPNVWDWNPSTRKWSQVRLSTVGNEIETRVQKTIDDILGEGDRYTSDSLGYGHGNAKHFRHRQLDIPNELVWKYIQQNPLAIMRTYTARISPELEFRKRFGQDVDAQLFEMEYKMMRDGLTDDQVNKARKEFLGMYERVTQTFMRNPDALNQKVAFGLKNWASFNFMGSAGFSAFPDFARVILEHEMGTIIRSLTTILDRSAAKLTADEIRIAGEAIDQLRGVAWMRFDNDMANDLNVSEFWNKARSAFYTLNGLGPLTSITKTLDGMIRQHTIIDYAVNFAKGNATPDQMRFLSRYNIDEDTARQIADAPWQISKGGMYMANTEAWESGISLPATRARVLELLDNGDPPGKTVRGRYIPAHINRSAGEIYVDVDFLENVDFQRQSWANPTRRGVDPLPENAFLTPKEWSNFVTIREITRMEYPPSKFGMRGATASYENRINTLAMAEFKSRSSVSRETLDRFRGAMNMSVANTVISGTPADRPFLSDGIAFIPMRIARKFNMEEDADFRGYARIENGLLSLPFQFMNYTLGSLNKTIAGAAHGQLKNQFVGFSTMFALGYLSVKLRTPEWAWNEMSEQDRIARAFDSSGVLALYSDMFYRAMHTSLALGGPNISNGFLNPRVPQQPNLADAINTWAGAGPSIAWDTFAVAPYEFMTDSPGEGYKTAFRNLPFARMWMWKDYMNDMTRVWAR
jgi:hypothetical protein